VYYRKGSRQGEMIASLSHAKHAKDAKNFLLGDAAVLAGWRLPHRRERHPAVRNDTRGGVFTAKGATLAPAASAGEDAKGFVDC